MNCDGCDRRYRPEELTEVNGEHLCPPCRRHAWFAGLEDARDYLHDRTERWIGALRNDDIEIAEDFWSEAARHFEFLKNQHDRGRRRNDAAT